MIRVVKRQDIPSISEIDVDGKSHTLGYLADFRKSPVLRDFIPESGRLSLSWVGLKTDEVLPIHVHPTKSMIIVCKGVGLALGDDTSQSAIPSPTLNAPSGGGGITIEEGDVVLIPPDQYHGFVGGDPEGFFALSVQFEGNGLYEDLSQPRVAFISSDDAGADHFSVVDSSMATFLRCVEENAGAFDKQDFVGLLEDIKSYQSPEESPVARRLFQILQLWSSHFQTLISARLVFPTLPRYWRLAQDHMAEELYHDRSYDEIVTTKIAWDPVVDSISAWFRQHMLVADDVTKTILMHFVIEKAGDVFYSKAAKVFTSLEHFKQHGEFDKDHVDQAVKTVQLHDIQPHHFVLLERGWEMMTKLTNYMAHYAASPQTKAE